MKSPAIFQVMEFYGTGDPFSAGMPPIGASTSRRTEALRSSPVRRRSAAIWSWPPTEYEAEAAGAAASTRKGSISALSIKPRIEVPTGQISWIVATKHVGAEDDALVEDFISRAKRAGAGDRDLVAQIVAYALACHRANQALVAAFRL